MADFAPCTGCGKPVSGGLTWCPFCGRELAAEPAPETAPPPGPPTEFAADLFGIPDEPADGDPSSGTAGAAAPDEPAETAAEASCVSCGRPVDARLTWCPFCGERQRDDAEAAPPSAGESPEPWTEAPEPWTEAPEPWTEAPEPPPADEEALPPPPARRGTPLGVDGPRHAPDLDRETRRVQRRKVAGMVMSVIVIVASVALVAVIFTLLLRSGGDGGESTSGSLPEEVFTTFTPTRGDCLDYRSNGEIVEEDCDAEHNGEVFATPRYSSASPFPGNEALADFADAECLQRFQPYVGEDYWSSGLTFVYIYPTAAGWAEGDRTISCVIEDPLGGMLSASVHGSGGIDHPGYLPFQRLGAGTCWDFTFGDTELVPLVDCSQPHDAETFASFDFPEAAFPGDAAAVALGERECAARYGEYVADAADPAVDWFAAVPNEFEWRHGYRVVTCSLFRTDDAKLTASQAG